ncbi:hypothetical protein EJ04DRAFT_568986 [Polyplosphaeria fusca]|uniref:Uncharacterized protein n=1 Tax=Polyplosphaeria fusca TaxID=682080 RepID=A0A9P4QKM1_9PLEO|nr:hypothetical protein EJ04DRAFT_568986 [Polyplosphaeria fusca]
MTFKQLFAAYFVSQALSLTVFAASLPHIHKSAEMHRPVKRADPTWHPSCDEHPKIKDAWPRALHMAQHAIDVLASNDPFSDQNAVNQSPFELWWEPARLNLFGQNSLTSHDDMLTVVSNLLFLGITRYRVDFLARTITSYASATHGYAVHIAPFPASHEHKFGSKWNEEKLVEAIRRAQRGEGNYIEFSKKVVEEAGVADYVAYLEGGRVVYFGEGGEERVEWFPGAKGAGEE